MSCQWCDQDNCWIMCVAVLIGGSVVSRVKSVESKDGLGLVISRKNFNTYLLPSRNGFPSITDFAKYRSLSVCVGF